MSLLGWVVAFGALLVVTSVTSGWIRRGPITSFAVYLVAGVLAGPAMLALAHMPLDRENAEWLRAATETGLVVSLFITGLKLRVPFSHPGWRAAGRLAVPGMLLTIGGLVAFAHVVLAWPWPIALALAAILSPTDPVLANLVSVDDARDDDDLRVTLSGEAGLNDGTALPFLLLALIFLGSNEPGADAWVHWAAVDLLWDWLGGIALGFAIGWGVGFLGTHLRHVAQDVAPSDVLALGIMGLAYGGAELVHASGFLAAFAAGVGLRRIELRVARKHPDAQPARGDEHGADHAGTTPSELLVRPNERSTADNEHPSQTVGWVVSDALSFGDTVERLIGAGLVFIVGVAVIPAFSWSGVLVAAALFFVIRPASAWLSTAGLRAPWQRRLLMGWFGIRGLGSLNYLAYALTHGLDGHAGTMLAEAVLTVVALSILVHGVTTTPLMTWRARALARKVRSDDDKRQDVRPGSR
jgi:NhaP-type Na+/H+ or K+/H+ antiporter